MVSAAKKVLKGFILQPEQSDDVFSILLAAVNSSALLFSTSISTCALCCSSSSSTLQAENVIDLQCVILVNQDKCYGVQLQLSLDLAEGSAQYTVHEEVMQCCEMKAVSEQTLT